MILCMKILIEIAPCDFQVTREKKKDPRTGKIIKESIHRALKNVHSKEDMSDKLRSIGSRIKGKRKMYARADTHADKRIVKNALTPETLTSG